MHIHTYTSSGMVADWRALVAVEYFNDSYIHARKTIPFCFPYILAQSSVPTRWFRVENSLCFLFPASFLEYNTRIYISLYVSCDWESGITDFWSAECGMNFEVEAELCPQLFFVGNDLFSLLSLCCRVERLVEAYLSFVILYSITGFGGTRWYYNIYILSRRSLSDLFCLSRWLWYLFLR